MSIWPEHIPVSAHQFAQFLTLLGSEGYFLEDLGGGVGGNKGRVRHLTRVMLAFQQVHMVQLCGVATAQLSHLVIHRPHLLHHLVGPVPLRQELTLTGGHQNNHLVPGIELPDLGILIVPTGLFHLCPMCSLTIGHMRAIRWSMAFTCS